MENKENQKLLDHTTFGAFITLSDIATNVSLMTHTMEEYLFKPKLKTLPFIFGSIISFISYWSESGWRPLLH